MEFFCYLCVVVQFRIMHFKRLILLLVATLWVACTHDVRAAECSSIDPSPTVEIPQWAELGMHDVLAAGGVANLVPPSTVRVANHNNPASGANQPGGVRHATYTHGQYEAKRERFVAHNGYIYRLCRLRL